MPLVLLVAGCATAVGYRYAYVKLLGKHKPPPVQISFTLQNLNTDEAFEVIRNPTLLDETTPFWFRLVIRKHSVEAIKDFLAKSDPKMMPFKDDAKNEASQKDNDQLQLPLYFDYWMRAFLVPFPWRSKVTHCEKHGATDSAQYQLTYEQAFGPFFGGFVHTHIVHAHNAGGSQVDDTIEFDVTSEPVVNNITWHVLSYLLRGRCENLNGRYGGTVLA
eukprot:Skav222270  [mRNA]  locus=scaffold807:5992:6645:+ [translate_table: standard]